jgi:hypothetical protein
MTVSRWKVMAGVIGASVGGLAIASQYPKPSDTRRAEEPLAMADAPKAPAGGAAPVKPMPPELPPPAPAGAVPLLPPLPGSEVPTKLPEPTKSITVNTDIHAAFPAPPTKLPEPAKPSTKPADLPALPPLEPSKGTDAKKPEPPKPDVVPAAGGKNVSVGSEPVNGVIPVFAPTLPPGGVVPPPPSKPVAVELPPPGKPTADPLVKPLPVTPDAAPVKPSAAPVAPPVSFTAPAAPPSASPLITPVEPSVEAKTVRPAVEGNTHIGPAVVSTPVPAAAAVQTKFRIVLRVGEGEPTFEVRHGDDLVMKVKSDKVDIKSPEKGQGLSAVTATGKVKFVGFGAEGTCDTLSFLAGTGEVSMAGSVNVKVRDKIGRVESELNADKMQYKLDSSSLPGVLKP